MNFKTIQFFRAVLQVKIGIKAFPILHTDKYRQASFIDINNVMGRGVNAVYSATGYDKSVILFLAPSIEEYLRQHCASLMEDRFFLTKAA